MQKKKTICGKKKSQVYHCVHSDIKNKSKKRKKNAATVKNPRVLEYSIIYIYIYYPAGLISIFLNIKKY